ncbi:hypothetical protein LXL04_020748 [Taraxacum kok-saghyz]
MDFRYARPPPPPPPSSDPHQRPPQQPVPPPPGTWYSGQFQYHSPSPPPPQWPPQTQHSDHHLPPPHPYAVAPPPPMPYSSSPYPLPPRPHMPLPPPHPHYPPGNQEWSNTNWGHQGWDYSAHNKNEDDWAARARAWAASKSVTDDQHQQSQLIPASRPEETNYQDPPYTEFQQHSFPPSSYQQYSSSFAPPPRTPANHLQEQPSFTSGYTSDGSFSYTARDGNLRDPAAAFPHQEPTPTSLSVHQQEVPSSYSSVPGKEESRETNGSFYQPSHMPFASAPQHQIQPPISPVSVEQQPHYSFSTDPHPTTDLSNQPLDFVPRFSHDPTGAASSGMHPAPSFGRMPPGNPTFPIVTSNTFHASSGFPIDTYGFPDRNKKGAVPNWLREEIIKKKAVIGSSSLVVSRQDNESNEDEVMLDGKSFESSRSTEEEDDDEDYVEAARTAAINQEIKRILTEVLLKVTDELFDEIATKVLEEDKLTVEVENKSIASSDTIPTILTPKSSAKVLIPSKTKGDDSSRNSNSNSNSNSSSPGDVLGLGNYASDDDDDEVQKLSIQSSINSKPAENGTSQVDDNKFVEKESDSQNGNLFEAKKSSQTDNGTQEHRNDDSGGVKVSSDGKHQVLVEEGVTVSANSSLPDDSQGEITNKSVDKKRSSSKDYNEEVEKAHTKVAEDNNNNNNRIEDERHVKNVIKKDERNGLKEKTKDQDSGKKGDNKKEIRRSRDKEDGRKRERTKDERSSSRHQKRHHSYASSDSSSDDSRRKVHSKRRNSSPSPVRSRRQVSRSPPTKRSQHRHYNYSSLETSRYVNSTQGQTYILTSNGQSIFDFKGKETVKIQVTKRIVGAVFLVRVK